jgi:hypothetical protein
LNGTINMEIVFGTTSNAMSQSLTTSQLGSSNTLCCHHYYAHIHDYCITLYPPMGIDNSAA